MQQPDKVGYPVMLDESVGQMPRKLISISFQSGIALFALFSNLSGCMELRDDVVVE
jgi:hypothetical protein